MLALHACSYPDNNIIFLGCSIEFFDTEVTTTTWPSIKNLSLVLGSPLTLCKCSSMHSTTKFLSYGLCNSHRNMPTSICYAVPALDVHPSVVCNNIGLTVCKH